jgi:nucleoside-diphosphate-sugar epimerase
MARVLIVGCGCRGRALSAALAGEGYAVRGTSRRLADADALVERVIADPDQLHSLVAHLQGVSAICWLLGSATGPTAAAVNGPRLETVLEYIVDTPVRGLVYEAAGALSEELLAGGEGLVRAAGERWQLRVAVVHEDPAHHERWLAAMTLAVGEVLG